jgi:hypothetical protein
VTIFEVLHHVILIFLRTSARGVVRIHRTMRCHSPNKPQVSIRVAGFSVKKFCFVANASISHFITQTMHIKLFNT